MWCQPFTTPMMEMAKHSKSGRHKACIVTEDTTNLKNINADVKQVTFFDRIHEIYIIQRFLVFIAEDFVQARVADFKVVRYRTSAFGKHGILQQYTFSSSLIHNLTLIAA